MIGHRSADAADEVASFLARGVVLGMFERMNMYYEMRTVNVNRRRGLIYPLRGEIPGCK